MDAAEHFDWGFPGIQLRHRGLCRRSVRRHRTHLWRSVAGILLRDRLGAERSALLFERARKRRRGWTITHLSGHSLPVLERGWTPDRPGHRAGDRDDAAAPDQPLIRGAVTAGVAA